MWRFQISQYLQDWDRANRRGNCKACGLSVPWSMDRVASHKRGTCTAVTAEEKRKFAKRVADNLNTSDANISAELNQSMRKECSNCDLTDEMTKEINSKVADFFFRTGISFRLADSDVFKEMIKSLNPAYAESMPSARTLSGPLLDHQYAKCSVLLEEILEASDNLTLVSDGWTNIRGDHLVNFCIKASDRKPFFYTSINTSGITQNCEAVAGAIIKVFEDLGSHKFSCLITDNAPAMRAAWKLIEGKFPHISANGCAAHGVNLLIKDILNTTEYSTTIKDAEKIIKYVTNHHLVKSKYEEQRKLASILHTLSMSVATRWFSVYNSMKDLLASKYVLIQLADKDGDTLKNISPKTTSAAVLKLIKLNEFWQGLAKLVKTIEYPANVIGKLEGDEAKLSLVYHYFGQLYNHYEYDKIIQDKVKARLKFLFTNSMGLAYMFTPKYAANGFFFDENQIDIIGYAKEFTRKIDPASADDVHQEMLSFITKMSTLPPKHKEIIFEMDAKTYWNVFGRRDFPSLFKVAKPIVEMICSSAAAERTWSTFRFIHSRLRNRLTNERVEKLVFIYTNCVLLDEKDKNDYILEEGAVITGNDCEEINETPQNM